MDFVGFLPKEITNFIFESLPVADLLSCTLCSKTWRQAVNSDEFWFKFCIEKGWADGIDKTSCQSLRNALHLEVPASKSHIQIPNCISLDPLCDWRIYYTECVMMRKRWRSGTCVRRNILHSDMANRDFLTRCMACDGELLAVGDDSGRVILWNITGDPVYIVQTYESRQDDAALTDVHLHQKHLLIERGQVLRVHRITNLRSKSTVAYELNEESYLEYTGPGTYDTMKKRLKELTENWLLWYKYCLAFQDGMMALSGSLISQVHIFRVATGELIQSITLPGSFFCIGELLFFHEDLYISSYSVLGAEGQGCVFVRNFKECSWKKEAECSEAPIEVLVNEKIIVVRTRSLGVYIWNRKDGERVDLGFSFWGLVLYGRKLAYLVDFLPEIQISDSASKERISLGEPWMYDHSVGLPTCMAKGREHFLVSVSGRYLQIWDMDTGAFMHRLKLNPCGEQATTFLFVWSDATKIIAVPFCILKNDPIVLFDFRFNSS